MQKTVPAISLVLCVFLIPSLRPFAQQQSSVGDDSEENTEDVRGKVVSFSPGDHALAIETDSGKQLTFEIDSKTQIISQFTVGSDVVVTYIEDGGKRVARSVVNAAATIEVQSPTAGIHLMPIVVLALAIVAIVVAVQIFRSKRRTK